MSVKHREEKFIKLIETRTNKVLNNLRLIQNLANKSNYTYDVADAKKALLAIKVKIRQVERTFSIYEDHPVEFKLRGGYDD